MKTVVVTDYVFPNLEPERAVLDKIATLVDASSATDGELLRILRDADAVLNCYRPLSVEAVEAMDRCRIIARYGIGIDTVPLELATTRGIQVTNVPDYCIEEVADHSLALILSLTRGIVRAVEQTRQGGWDVAALRPLHRQRGRVMGLVGFGRIAQALAKRASVMGYQIVAHDPFLDAADIRAAGATPLALDALFGTSDVVSLHAPLTEDTRHIVNERSLATMRPGSILVNAGRGGLVDFDAVCAALRAGRLGGAALDVMEVEPPTARFTEVAELPNLIVTPHLAFYSEEALTELQEKAALQVRAMLKGERPAYPVNSV